MVAMAFMVAMSVVEAMAVKVVLVAMVVLLLVMVAVLVVAIVALVMQMLAWPWKVPMLNVTDCIISFCIVLLVTTSTLYLNKIETCPQNALNALFYRSAMGGKKELAFFNLGRVATSEELAKKVKDLAAELEKSTAADLSTQLKALSVFDTQKITTCITLLATEVAPPAEDGRSFKFNKRIASGSFDPALKRKPQSRQFSSREELAPKAPEAKEEGNEVNQIVETPEKDQNKETTLKTSWI
eukprot:s447_g5.t2